MIAYDLFENQNCPHCGGPAFSNLKLAEKKDACYSKVRSRYKVWPSAYASGALVQCRKKGADNWGNKSKGVTEALPPVAAAAAAVARQQAVAKGAAQAVGGATASNAFMSAADRLGAGQSGETNLSNIQAPESLEQGNAPKKLKKDGRGAKFRKQSKQQSVAEGGIPNLRKVMVPTVGQRVIADVSGYGRFGLDGTEPGVIVRIPSPRLIKVKIDKDGEIYDFTNNELYQQGVAEGKQKINWIKPNFDFEWHEVEEQSKMKQVPADVRQYYQKHFPNKDAWIKAVQNGKAVVVPPDHAYEIRNAPWDKASLQKVLAPTGHEGSIGPAKEKRVNDLFDKGQVEMPIILKTSQGLWLIGGKTRLGTANYIKGIPAKVWLVGGEQGVAEDSRSHEERLDQRNAVEQVALHNRQMDYFQQFVDWSGKEMKDIYNNMDNHQLAYELENLGMQIAGNWRNQKYYKPGDPKREQFYSLMKQWYDLYKEAERKFSKDQGVAEGSEYTPPKLGTVKASIMNTTTPTVQIQVFKHNTLRGDSYWVTKQVKKFKTMDQAKAYVDRINNQGVAEGSDKTFTVIYYSKKTDRTVTKQIKASSESELWDRLRAKDIDVISVEEQGVVEGSLNENQNSGIVYATGPRTTGTNDVDLIFKNLTTNKIVAWVVGNNDDGGVYEIRINQNGVKKGPPNFVATGNPQDDSDQHLIYKLGKPGTGRMSAIGSVMQNGFDKKNSTYYGQPLEFVGDDDWWSFLENMIGDITWEDDAIDAGYVDRLDNGDLVFVKQNLSRDSLNELAPNPGGGDGGGGDDGDDGFELPLDFKGQNVLVWPKNKKYSMGDTATPFPRGEQFTGKVYIMWDGPKIEAIFYLDPKDREDREAEYERVYGPQGRGYEDWLDHKWYDTTTPRYRFVTDWRLIPAKEPGGWPGIVDAWGQDMKAEVMNHAQNFINDIIHNDGDGRHFVEPKQSVTEGYLNEFAPGDGNGEGRWYTDDQMIDMVGPDWAPEDDAGHLTLAQRLQDAQAWLDDQGYSVAVEDVQIDPDGGYRWKIYGEFYNPRFAKKDQGVAETSDYFRRREREEAIISGQKPARKKQPAQTSDYARRREQEKKAEKGVAEMDDRRHVRYHQVYGDPGENPRASEYRGPWYLDVEGTILQDKNSQPQQFWSYDDAYQYAVNLTNYLRQHGQPLKYAIAITREPKSNSAKI